MFYMEIAVWKWISIIIRAYFKSEVYRLIHKKEAKLYYQWTPPYFQNTWIVCLYLILDDNSLEVKSIRSTTKDERQKCWRINGLSILDKVYRSILSHVKNAPHNWNKSDTRSPRRTCFFIHQVSDGSNVVCGPNYRGAKCDIDLASKLIHKSLSFTDDRN